MTVDKRIKLIAEKLQSTRTDEVLFTIKQMRNTGESKILPFLFERLANTKSEEIKLAIISLLNDLKDKNCRIEIIKALKNDNFKNIHQEILATCWQSGLDYSDDIDLFVSLFITRDFGVAFEAFTIIDNFEEAIEAEKINPLLKDLKSSISKFKETQKEGLFVELVHILEGLRA